MSTAPSKTAIHAGLRALGLGEEEDRRALYARVTGKTGLCAMTARERAAVLDELRRLGLRPPAPARRLDGPYAAKLRALWIAGWNLALVGDRRDGALIAFVRRQTGLHHPRFLTDPTDAARAIEALKAWLARERGVRWHWPRGTARSMARPEAAVALAQLAALCDRGLAPRNATLMTLVEAHLGPAAWVCPDGLSVGDWQRLMNALGARLRGAAAV
jgi:hypothetical protein